MEANAVTTSYRRWAPFYDATFGYFTTRGRKTAVDYINTRRGEVLEVGVGTGLALGYYRPDLAVTGIDFSAEMLAKAEAKVKAQGLSHVKALRQMDARSLDFPDAAFDTVVAMYLVSVVPEPERVVAEMARVCRAGGEVLLLNHFARPGSDGSLLARLERGFAPFADTLGWHPDFEKDRVLGAPGIDLAEERTFPPLGMFTFLRFVKRS